MKTKTYEVVIDLGSKTFVIDAKCEEEAEIEALKLFEELSPEDKIEEYWVGDVSEFEDLEVEDGMGKTSLYGSD